MYRIISSIGAAILWVLLPKCSLCLMAYAGIFSAMGLGSLVRNRIALPLIIGLLAVNLAAVVYMSVIKKEYGYALLSLGCAILLTVNKLYIGSATINVIAALVLLMAILRIRLFRVKTKQCIFKDASACSDAAKQPVSPA